ncbi:glycosyltransferase family 39 protein [Streptomyces sp. NBC_01186]|uniref:ArnT family glycosyltransferase n=1 Tax=Streptomyces sp. NBC_01186 TaxID=2903765 RepID=UPI002E129542|nr:glycosyltransferase family 39 protein [Streptomyces sp. NBC_01186]
MTTLASAHPHPPDQAVPDDAHPRTAPLSRRDRAAYWALLAATAALFLWGLGASGYANSFYSAAAQAGGASWKAMLFGSLDAGNAITVDKPPAALWPMALSVRLFGLGSWQILVPQALLGVGTVAVLYAAVRRRFGPGAGLLAGALLALTPVAALMFRFNNPDALLCLLMVSAIACVLRALEQARTKWLVLAGICFGLAFLTKTLQAWLILPPLAIVYLVCAPGRPLRRTGQLLLGGLAMVVSCGWYVALAELWPAASRPYMGGSQHNSFLELTLGYNGLGRLTGEETGSVGGGPKGGGGPGGGGPGGGGGGGWGETGLGRLFNDSMGGQIAWLLPAALVLLAAGLVVTRRAARTDGERAAFLAWGGSLLMTAATFSFMSGIFHEYYNIALAPYICALVAMGAVTLWRRRAHPAASATLAVTVAGTAVWSAVLLGRAGGWLPWLRWTVLAVGLVAAVALLAETRVSRRTAAPRRVSWLVAALGLVAMAAGPVAYTLNTVATPHTGSIVTAGPAVARGGPGGPGGGPGRGGGFQPPQGAPGGNGNNGNNPNNTANGNTGKNQQNGQGRPPAQGNGGMPGGTPGQGGFPQGGQGNQGQSKGKAQGQGKGKSNARGARPGGGGGMRGGGGMGGLLNGSQVNSKAEKLLEKNAGDYTWAAAAVGSQNAASYQLATGKPVMALGGFNGSDPYPTLAGFKKYVREGKIHYFVGSSGGGSGGGPGGSGTSSSISSWVQKHYKKVTVGDAVFYDLTHPKSSGKSAG